VTSADPAFPKLAVMGQGYVGLPLAVRAVDVGMEVTGFDTDTRKVRDLRQGRSHVEDVPDAHVARAISSARYRPTDEARDLAGFDIAVITVPTPLREGAPDTSFIEHAARILGRFLRPTALVVLESTTFPGTTEEIVGPILEAESGLRSGVDFHLGYSPERIDPGNAEWDFRRTPKVVSGIDDESLKHVQLFYDRLVDTTVPVRGCREAELCKLLENTFRHVNIALVNEMAMHAKALGIDFWDVLHAASTKPFGFMPFRPGPGVGGHCLPIDPSYLSWKVERQLRTVSRFVKVANDVNDHMPDYVVRRVQRGLNDRGHAVKGSRILVLGVAYKPGTGDARETPATQVIEQLLDLGAHVRVHDPYVEQADLRERAPLVELSLDEVSAADAVVLITDHDDVDYALVESAARYVFDTRNRLRGENVEVL
jgi:UDP-N-acetyl-D-glucosamine dehydrogenase